MEVDTLKVDSINPEFDGRKILQDVYLNCSKGEVIGLLGRNGSGKSSLLKIIFGLLKPAYKYVSINDRYVKNGYVNNQIAYLPQQNYLPKGVKIKALAKMLVDDFFWDEFTDEQVYKNHADKTIGQLSGGELRILEMLLVIYNKADFILLDEPFTHISPIQTEYFKPIIRKCAQIKGIIVTDHQYRNVLEVSDKLILLHNGTTKHIKNVDELITYGYISGIN
ncbi:MAG: ATP-binding cassette domain-containing protein [Mucilaginibacter sp.]